MSHRDAFVPALALAGALLACPLAHAADAAAPAAAGATAVAPQQTPVAAPAAAVSGATAMRVVRDKATGQLRKPTEAELEELVQAEKAQRQARGERDPAAAPPAVVVRRHANGMLSAVLGTEHLVTIQATRGADGRLVRSHAQAEHDHPTAAPKAARPTE